GKQTSTEASAESPVSPTSSAEAAPSPEVAKQAPTLPPNSSTQQLSIKLPPQVPKVVPQFKTLVSLKLGFVKSNSQTVSKVLNIKLSPGELSILMGRNASGKSTLVSALTAAGKFEVSGRGPPCLRLPHHRSFNRSTLPFAKVPRVTTSHFRSTPPADFTTFGGASAHSSQVPALTFGTWQSRKLLPNCPPVNVSTPRGTL
ncbi:MAG: hypothetical protein ACTS5A_03545, partial [Candidatus Hodgkinia cicadicola]